MKTNKERYGKFSISLGEEIGHKLRERARIEDRCISRVMRRALILYLATNPIEDEWIEDI